MKHIKQIKITLVRSPIGRPVSHKACLHGLGLRKIGSSRTLDDTASVRGMIAKVIHLLKVQELSFERVETRSRPGRRERLIGQPGYIWELSAWPRFTYNEQKLVPLIAQIMQQRIALRSRFDNLDLTEDAKKQVAAEVSQLEVSPGDPSGVAELMQDATNNFSAPINKVRLCGWQKKLFPESIADSRKIVVGEYRDDHEGEMVVQSGPIGKETTHFEAPPAERVSGEMQRFFHWLEKPDVENPMLVAAIAHLWFLTIHPFDNGNGRLARAITEAILARAENSPTRLYCVASQIHMQRKAYDHCIERTQKGGLDITGWLEWFLSLEYAAIESAEKSLTSVLRVRKFWQQFPADTFNQRQAKVLKKLFGPFEGKLTLEKWQKMSRCQREAAIADIEDLLKRGILIKNLGTKGQESFKLAL